MMDSGTQFEKHVKVFQAEPYPENSSQAKVETYDVVAKIEKLVDPEWRKRWPSTSNWENI